MITRTPTQFITGSGAVYDFAAPDVSGITIEDVAWGLACEPRFRGQTRMRANQRRCFYSVAEHCVRGSRAAPAHLQLPFLLHELDELLFGDMLAPLKATQPGFKADSKQFGAAMETHFNVPDHDRAAIKLLDQRMLATEKRDLYPQEDGAIWPWCAGQAPFDEMLIMPWPPEVAATFFLHDYAQLVEAA